jgi:hypothetical protein
MNGGHITFAANSTSYDVPVPDSVVTIDPSATMATTSFNTVTNQWETSIPKSFSGNAFIGAVAWPVPVNLPGGIHPVTWSAQFQSDAPISINWLWAAAVYSNFTSAYDTLGVKPLDDNHLSMWANSDHAGTPEYYKSYVVGGARGGGGANYTGSLTATLSVKPTVVGSCGGGTTCGGACVDTSTDPNNCGACGNVCGAGTTCAGGQCTCASGTQCGGTCVDTSTDGNNCGACGNVCASGTSCVNGTCQGSCNPHFDCGGFFVDSCNDTNNCGGCNVSCGFGATCNNGVCSF